MAAAPYRATLKFLGANGAPLQYSITASDVADAYYIFPSGDNFVQLPLDQIYYLSDIILTAAGTDTARSVIYVNQKSTPYEITNGMNLATNVSRQFMGSMIGFQPGSSLKFQQKA